MAEFERDFIIRQVRQLAEAIARIVRGARLDGDAHGALEALHREAEAALGSDHDLLDRMSPSSVALLTREPEVLRSLAWLAAQEGELREAAGEPAEARRLRERALALYVECAERFPHEAQACREAARALLGSCGMGSASEEFRRRLGGSGESN